MTSLYVVSNETFSGKTAIITGLMEHLRKEGFETGYMKPVSTTPRVAGRRVADTDAQFIKDTFDLAAPLSRIVPVKLTESFVEKAFRGERDLAARVKTVFNGLSADTDILFVEGGGDLAEGSLFGLSAPEVAELLDLPVLIVIRYKSRLTGDNILLARRILGERLVGAVVNSIPGRELDLFSDTGVPILEEHGIPIMGLLPRNRLLTAATVGELADGINGEILIGEDYSDALVENLTIGAMGVDNALAHFRRKPNKAVITGGDRPDIHLAALETSTRCLILTGNLHPSPLIVTQAEEKGVPIILSPQSTLETVETINQFFGRTRFHQAQKLEQFQEIFEANFDFDRLYQVLGLKS
ncbi:MAG: phosphotransacetylase family protein [Candidatus Neomarinimicrobiota bacterium]